MAISQHDDKKAEVTHEDHAPGHTDTDMTSSKDRGLDGDESVGTVQLTEPAPMTLIQCLKKYKYASFICVLAAIGSLSDGYQVQMSGSIIALPGFIRQFGELQPDGEYVLDPTHVSLWGCKYNPLILSLLMPADQWQRKPSTVANYLDVSDSLLNYC